MGQADCKSCENRGLGVPLLISHLSVSIIVPGEQTLTLDYVMYWSSVDLRGVRRLRAEEDAHEMTPKFLDLAGIPLSRVRPNQACILVALAVWALETRR